MKNIEWESVGSYRKGRTTTNSGLIALITEVQRTMIGKPLYSLYIEGDTRNACNRASLEKIMTIPESR